jgi:hypothetical protein
MQGKQTHMLYPSFFIQAPFGSDSGSGFAPKKSALQPKGFHGCSDFLESTDPRKREDAATRRADSTDSRPTITRVATAKS